MVSESVVKKALKGELVVITRDLVLELRRRGETWAANDLVRMHQKSLLKAKREVINDFQRKNRLLKKFKGVCIVCGNKPVVRDKSFCINCLKKDRLYQRRYKK